MAIEYQVFSGVKDVSLGETAIHGVRSISVVRRRAEVHASGDEDIFESVAAPAAAAVSGSLVLLDSAQADELDRAVGTLSFTWYDSRARQDKTVTVANVSITGTELASRHRDAAGASMGFVAQSSDGVTAPVWVTGAVCKND